MSKNFTSDLVKALLKAQGIPASASEYEAAAKALARLSPVIPPNDQAQVTICR